MRLCNTGCNELRDYEKPAVDPLSYSSFSLLLIESGLTGTVTEAVDFCAAPAPACQNFGSGFKFSHFHHIILENNEQFSLFHKIFILFKDINNHQ
jgi:hypothetical protein